MFSYDTKNFATFRIYLHGSKMYEINKSLTNIIKYDILL